MSYDQVAESSELSMALAALERLVPNPRGFLNSFWNERPVMFTAEQRGAQGMTPDLQVLKQILGLPGIRRPYVRLTDKGRPVAESAFTQWRRVQGAVIESVDWSTVGKRVALGATMTMDSFDDLDDDSRALCSAIEVGFGAWVEASLFLTPAGHKGLTVHHDNADVFVIQVHGSKQWSVFKQRRPLPADGKVYQRDQVGDPELEVTVHAGDCLYIPWGSPHYAVALDNASVHLSIMVRQRTVKDLLGDLLDKSIIGRAYEGLRVPATTNRAQRDGEAVAQWGQMLQQISAERERTSAPSSGPSRPATGWRTRFLTQTNAAQQLSPSSVVVPLGRDDVKMSDEAGPVLLRVATRTYRFPNGSRPIIAGLLEPSSAVLGQVCDGEDIDSSIRIAKRLIEAGVLTVVNAGSGGQHE